MQTPFRDSITPWTTLPIWLWGSVAIGAIVLGVVAVLLPLVYVTSILVGLVIVALVFWQPAIGAGIYVFMNYSRLIEYVPQLQQIRVMFLLACLLACSVFLHNLLSGNPWWFGGTLRNVLSLAVAVLLSVPLATWKSNSLNGATEFLKIVFGILLVANSIKTERQLVWFLRLLAFMFAWLSITVVWNHFTGNIVLEGHGTIVRTRGAGSMLEDSNDIAAVMLMLVPIALCGIRYDPSRLAKAIYGLSLPMGLMALVLGGSRGGFLGFLWLLFILFVRSKRRLTFAVIGFLVLIATWFAAPPYWRERMLSIKDYRQDESAMARVYLWQAAKGMVRHNPLTGIGIGNFEDFATSYGARSWQVAHNTFYQIMGETGLLGLTAYLLYLAHIWRVGRRWATNGKGNPLQAWLGEGLSIGYLVFIVPSYFLSLSYYTHTYLPAAVLSAGERLYRADKTGVGSVRG